LASPDQRYLTLIDIPGCTGLSRDLVRAIESTTQIDAVNVHTEPESEPWISVSFHRSKSTDGYYWWVRDTVKQEILDGPERNVKVVPGQ